MMRFLVNRTDEYALDKRSPILFSSDNIVLIHNDETPGIDDHVIDAAPPGEVQASSLLMGLISEWSPGRTSSQASSTTSASPEHPLNGAAITSASVTTISQMAAPTTLASGSVSPEGTPKQPTVPSSTASLTNSTLSVSPTSSSVSATSSISWTSGTPATSLVSASMTSMTASPTTRTDHAVIVPTNPAQVNRNPQVYNHALWIGLVAGLGVLIFIAIICTVVAWWVRSRSTFRRRKLQLEIDALGDPGAGDGIFAPERHSHFPSVLGSEVGGSMCDLTGDRDVGEPRRSASFLPASIIQAGADYPFPSTVILPGTQSKERRFSISYSIAPSYVSSSTEPTLGRRSSTVERPQLNRVSTTGLSIRESMRALGPLQVANFGTGDAEPPSRPLTPQHTTRSSHTEPRGVTYLDGHDALASHKNSRRKEINPILPIVPTPAMIEWPQIQEVSSPRQATGSGIALPPELFSRTSSTNSYSVSKGLYHGRPMYG